MKNNIKFDYTAFHLAKKTLHNYPTEWVIRTMLGSYPALNLDKSKYQNGKVLDLGFGDGRNIQLLLNCGLDVYGVEVTNEICDSVNEMLLSRNSRATLKVGTNSNIPFGDCFFDYVLASSSCYYVDGNTTFIDNVREIFRVLQPGGFLIANFPLFSEIKEIEQSFILKNCEFTEDGHVIIRNDIYGIRNGYRFKAFYNEMELTNELKDSFKNICCSKLYDNYFGIQINALICVAQKSYG